MTAFVYLRCPMPQGITISISMSINISIDAIIWYS